MLKVVLVFMIEYQFKGKNPEPKRKEIKVSKNYLDSKPGIIEVKHEWQSVAVYCNQKRIGGSL